VVVSPTWPILFPVVSTWLIVGVALARGLVLPRDDTVGIATAMDIDVVAVAAIPTNLNHFRHFVLDCGHPELEGEDRSCSADQWHFQLP
jgi:hypothetical protein